MLRSRKNSVRSLAALALVIVTFGAQHRARAACGTVTAWGSKTTALIVPAGLTDVRAISAGIGWAVAIKLDGTLIGWGDESQGWKAGLAGKKDIVAVSGGLARVVALTKTGTVLAWGWNHKGQSNVPAGLSAVTAIATGYYHSVALKSDGTIVAWGSDTSGCVNQANGQKGFKAIAAAQHLTAGIKTDGTVVIWGDGGTVKTVPNGLQARQIALGSGHAVAIHKDNTVVAWGDNTKGQTTVPSGLKDVVQVSAGSYNCVALKADGTLVAWGSNQSNESNVTQGSGYFAVSMVSSSGFGLKCAAACQSISPIGCCGSGVAVQCVDDGGGYKIAKTACGSGKSCGWDGAKRNYVCGSTSMEAPGGMPSKFCGFSCTPQCTGKTCGSDDCGGSCGSCKSSELCDAKTSSCKCAPQCSGKTCGADGCGGSCGTCKTSELCDAQTSTCKPKCTPQCSGKNCGTDGCGGSCGSCKTSELCDAQTSTCKPKCTPQCSGKNCGGDGCGGSCGTCKTTDTCDATTSTCKPKCTPQCTGKNCGGDGCGGTCGTCKSTDLCDATVGICKPKCTPQCSGKTCGANGCGGSCGTCKAGDTCEAGTCKPPCKPNCTNRICGSDGCGGTCGACAPHTTCDDKKGFCRYKYCPDVPVTNCCAQGKVRSCWSKPYDTGCNSGSTCGWQSSQKRYGCVPIGQAGSDPSGVYPKNCPGVPVCTPDCKGKNCGHDGCGGLCGTCTSPKKCSSSGVCKQDPCAGVPKKRCCVDGNTQYCGYSNGKKVPKVVSCSAYGLGPCGWHASYQMYGCGGYGADPTGKAIQKCPTTLCVPQCAGKYCGADGCGGTCGKPCPADRECKKANGFTGCVKKCTPSCQGKACGSNGCGGTCPNTCGKGTYCVKAQHICKPFPNLCPDVSKTAGCCDGNTLKSCAAHGIITRDCKWYGGRCGWTGTKYDCMKEGKADPSGKNPWICKGGQQCQPNCKGKTCGPDGCGGTCGKCKAPDTYCNVKGGICEAACKGMAAAGCCADGKLRKCGKFGGTAEKILTADCKGYGLSCGWSDAQKLYVCGAGSGAEPSGSVPKACPPPCVPKCTGKSCGDDGCGGTCGTCGTGHKCDVASGVCKSLPPPSECGTVHWEGGCDGDNVLYCANKTLVKRSCLTEGSQHCGWQDTVKAYTCGTGGYGHKWYPKTIKGGKDKCVPDCQTKQCGADGCGGTCGGCASGSTCNSAGLCKPQCGDLPGSGCCDGELLKICSAAAPSTIDCSKQLMGHTNAGDPIYGTCAFDTAKSSYACIAKNKSPPKTDPSGKVKAQCPACTEKCDPAKPCSLACGKQCGTCTAGSTCDWGKGICTVYNAGSCLGHCTKQHASWQCQCDKGCFKRGDCCKDYNQYCLSLGAKSQYCGDLQCDYFQGETCSSCATDCGACTPTQQTKPPFNAPAGVAVKVFTGTKAARVNRVTADLDELLPAGPPLPREDLLARIVGGPSPVQAHGHPGVRVLSGKVPGVKAGGVTNGFSSEHFQGLRFATNDGKKPNWGTLRLIPPAPLPRKTQYRDQHPGGMTLAMWVHLPANQPNLTNPLASLAAIPHGSANACQWSRKQDSAVTVQCPKDASGNPQKIIGVRAYYGEVDGYVPPRNNCAVFESLRPTYRCNYDGIQQLVEKACLGKSECHPNPWDIAKDPCSKPPHKPNNSTLMVRAVCATAEPAERPTLLVGDKSAGQTLQWKMPGSAPLKATTSHAKGGWAHVAVTLQPFAEDKKRGITTLYVDGQMQARSLSLPMPEALEVMIGATPRPNASSATNGANGWLATVALFVDDISLYGRALGASGVLALRSKDAARLAYQWPSTAPRHIIANGYRLNGPGGQASKVQNTRILQSKPGKKDATPYLTARQRALSLAAGTTYEEMGTRGDLHKLKFFTLAAWIRVPNKLAPGKPLIELVEDGKTQLTIAASAACDGLGLTAETLNGVGKTPVACRHVLRPGDWHFVAYGHRYGRKELRIDGVVVGLNKNGSFNPIFTGPQTAQRGIRVSGGVDLYWAALYRRFMLPEALEEMQSSGPAVWLGKKLYKPTLGANWRLLDHANLHRNTGASDPVGYVETTLNKSIKISNPLVLSSQFSGNTQKRWIIPADGRFRFGDSHYKHPAFTWMGRVVLPKYGEKLHIPLLGLVGKYIKQNTTRTMFAAKLFCHHGYNSAKLTGKKLSKYEVRVPLSCRVETSHYERLTGKVVYASTKDVVGHYSAWVSSPTGKPNQVGQTVNVAFSFDGLQVSGVSIGSPTAQVFTIDTKTKSVGKSLGMEPVVLDVKTVKTSDWMDKGLLPAATEWFFDNPAFTMFSRTGGDTVFEDVRMYARAVSRQELYQLGHSSCAFEPCEGSGRTCLQPESPALSQMSPVCGACEQPSVSTSSASGERCFEKKGFMQACTIGHQCRSGVCEKARCVAASKTQECTDTCAGLGRACVKESDWQPNAKWICSKSCAAHYEPPTPNNPASACKWAPDRDEGAVCEVDGQCKSGRCAALVEPGYSATAEWNPPCSSSNTCPGWKDHTLKKSLLCNKGNPKTSHKWLGAGTSLASCPSVVHTATPMKSVKRCTATTKAQCSDQNRRAIPLKGTGLGQSLSYQCRHCRSDTYKGRRLFRSSYAFMWPKACARIYNRYQNRWKEGLDPNRGHIFNDPTPNTLARFVLAQESGSVKAKQLKDLEAAGVGPKMLEYAFSGGKARAKLSEKYGALLMSDCINPTVYSDGKTLTSPYYDNTFNRVVCVPNKFPNGTPCPPPGVDKTKYSFAPGTLFANTPHTFCESGFCSRDSGKCEEGDGVLEANNNVNRSDKKKAKKSSFGPLSSIQLNQNVTEFTRRPGFGPKPFTGAVGSYRPDRRATHSGNDSGISFFGTSIPALRTGFKVTSGAASTKTGTPNFDTSNRVYFFGISLPVQKPVASCVGVKYGADGKSVVGECSKPSLDKFKYPKMPTFAICMPNPFACKPAGTAPAKPKTCVTKKLQVGVVPLRMEASVKLAVCVGVAQYADFATRSLGWQFTPKMGLALDVRAGVGKNLGGIAKVFAGIRAVLLIASVALPYRSGVAASKTMTNMWKVTRYDQLNLEITILKLSMSVFVQAVVAKVFNVMWEYALFDLTGFKFVQNLFRVEQSIAIDLIHPVADQVLKGNPGSGN